MMKRCKISVLLVCLTLVSAPAVAQTERVLENRISVCVDPATPPLLARSLEERQGKKCEEWSEIGSTSAVLEVLQFANCKNAEAPLAEFLRAILRTWNGQYPARNPTTSTIYRSPGKFQLRPVRLSESRVDALIVWKGSVDGMAALVVGDDNEPGTKPDLKRLKVLYPAKGTNCGKLKETSAEALANDLVEKKIIEKQADYKLLVARRPRLFWNQWVEKDGGGEQPEEINVGEFYRYYISFSALDFGAFRRGEREARDHLSPEEAANYLPSFERYKISVLPIGEFEKISGTVTNVRIDPTVLKTTLTASQVLPSNSYKTLAGQHDALEVIVDNGLPSKTFSYEFSVTKAGCPALGVIVWSNRRIVTSWVRPLRAVSEDSAQTEGCQKAGGVSRRVGPSVMPWFDTAEDPNAVARVSFIDFGSYSIGGLQDLRQADVEPLSWVVELPLRESLGQLSDYVNARVNDSNFDMHSSSEQLWKILFKCKDLTDLECDGVEALRWLRDLAEKKPGARVQASFRDIASNGIYYIPIHLLEQTTGNLLARRLRFVQPLPVPSSANTRRESCVNEWSGSLVVSDVEFFDQKGWRKVFFKSFIGAARHRLFKEPDNLDKLRTEYFEDTKLMTEAPEGLVLLAHHGNGDISDTRDRDAITRIKPDQVKRNFRPGSIALLVACSIGTLGDLNTNSSRFLFRLNEKDIQSAIISPFQVSPRLAQRFLENFKTVVENLKEDTPLFDVLEQTRTKFAGETSLGIEAAADIFMVVGDGDVKVCKPGGKP